MADIATPSAATMSMIDAGAESPHKGHRTKPEKPDEQSYKENLAKAEKEHALAQEKLVCDFTSLYPLSLYREQPRLT